MLNEFKFARQAKLSKVAKKQQTFGYVVSVIRIRFLPLSLCRYMLGLSVLPAMLQFIGFLFLPESPRWLIQRGLTQKARRVLSQIRGNQNIDEEYDSIKNSIDEEENSGGGKGGKMMENWGAAFCFCLTFFCAIYIIYNSSEWRFVLFDWISV